MNFLRSLLFNDFGRKLIALGIAALIWWRVDASMVSVHPWKFKVVTSEGTPDLHELKIDIPDDWMLINPKPGTLPELKFSCNDRTFDEFRAALCAAEYKVVLSETTTTAKTSFSVRAEDLDWQRPDLAKALLVPGQVIDFDLERRGSIELALDPSLLKVEGSISDGYALKQDQSMFSPNAVTLHGTISVGENTETLKSNLDLFKVVEIPADQNSELIREVKLSDRASREFGMWMEPEAILVTIPIQLQAAAPIEWRPTIPLTLGQAPDGLAWTVRTWANPIWLASYEPVEGLNIPFGADWLQQNVSLVVHLNQIPEGASEGYELLLDWIISDPNLMGSRTDLEKLKNALTIWPAVVDELEGRTVDMKKPEQS